jgi:3-hydroxyisobutyrate dehydrogenase-like beta-hydroxyacid dehydrogenase
MIGKPIERIALIGFGEAGGILGADFAKSGVSVTMFDILLRTDTSRPTMLAKAKSSNVRPCESLTEAISDAELIISAVTCSSALDVAGESSVALRTDQLYLDINSVSPGTKREMSARVESAGTSFIEAAVMAPVPPSRLRVPMLLGGSRAAELAPRLQSLGMDAQFVSDRIGVASAIKMCRSIVIKGIEALAVEAMFAARHYGAEEAVLASLDSTYPSMGWTDKLPDYLISRVAQHGKRRAAEMREVAETLSEAGLDPFTALGTAKRQDWLAVVMAEHGIEYRSSDPFSWRTLADALAKASNL